MELLAYSQESVHEKNLQLTARVVAFYCPLQTIVRADKHENCTFGSIIYDAREGEARKCKKGVEPSPASYAVSIQKMKPNAKVCFHFNEHNPNGYYQPIRAQSPGST